ncbi:MAG: CopG family transcriptional regulator [Deinococcota bacterium]
MRTTVYLPDDLARAVEAYLKEHPETSLSALVQESLAARLRRNPAVLLELAGIVEKASGCSPVGEAASSAGEAAEDRLYRRER